MIKRLFISQFFSWRSGRQSRWSPWTESNSSPVHDAPTASPEADRVWLGLVCPGKPAARPRVPLQ
jgi:hypothetical protein